MSPEPKPKRKKTCPTHRVQSIRTLAELNQHPLVKRELTVALKMADNRPFEKKDGLISAMVKNKRTLSHAKMLFAILGEDAWRIEKNLPKSKEKDTFIDPSMQVPAKYVNDFVRQFIDLYIKEYQKQHKKEPNPGIKKKRK